MGVFDFLKQLSRNEKEEVKEMEFLEIEKFIDSWGESTFDGVHENLTDPHIEKTVAGEKGQDLDRPPMESRLRSFQRTRAAKTAAINNYAVLTRNKRKDFSNEVSSLVLYSTDQYTAFVPDGYSIPAAGVPP